MNDLMTVNEAAAFMRVRPNTVYTWVENGRLPHLRAGSRILFEREVLLNWLRGTEGRLHCPDCQET
jgi:excisionase family DNA binding protein